MDDLLLDHGLLLTLDDGGRVIEDGAILIQDGVTGTRRAVVHPGSKGMASSHSGRRINR